MKVVYSPVGTYRYSIVEGEIMQEMPSRLDTRNRSRQALDLVTEKWTVAVIYTLRLGTQRFSDLQREIEGVSQKMLIQTLRKLEQDGLIKRTVYPVVPPKVEYTLTSLGETFLEPLAVLCRWTDDHMDEVYAARRRSTETRQEMDGHSL